MSDIVWKPNEDYIENANITRFMRKYNIKNYDELIKKSTDDIAWFWDAVIKDLKIEFYKLYTKVYKNKTLYLKKVSIPPRCIFIL